MTNWLKRISQDASSEQVLQYLEPRIISAAQEEYEQLNHEDDMDVLEEIANRVASTIVCNTDYTVSSTYVQEDNRNINIHVQTPDGVYCVHVPKCIYDGGTGYSWTKQSSFQFNECRVIVELQDDIQ